MKTGWIGVDLDGTLARYDGWISPHHIGEPIAPMVQRVKEWMAFGIEVRIVTSRVGSAYPDQVENNICAIKKWCMEVFGATLPITNEKDQHMMVLWDDRAVQVIFNQGIPVTNETPGQ